MKLRALVFALAAAGAAASLSAETWKNVSVIDSMCADKAKADPDKHTAKCALACADDGFGILTADGKFVKFDAAGNAKVVAALESAKKTDHLRADVEGEMKDGKITVTAFKLL
jgi:hypothetical protein